MKGAFLRCGIVGESVDHDLVSNLARPIERMGREKIRRERHPDALGRSGQDWTSFAELLARYGVART